MPMTSQSKEGLFQEVLPRSPHGPRDFMLKRSLHAKVFEDQRGFMCQKVLCLMTPDAQRFLLKGVFMSRG